MKRNKILEGLRRQTPLETRLLIDHSFALAERIAELLLKNELSQRDLAEKMGKKESEISKWMRGTHNFTLKTIAKLEAVLGEPLFAVAVTGYATVNESPPAVAKGKKRAKARE